MKIPLTKGRFAIIDQDDFELVSKYNWHVFAQKGYAGTDLPRKDGKKKLLMHRLIMNPPDKMEIDHINGNVLDNRKKNLRICTHQQNCSNHRGYKKLKGVGKVKDRPLKKPYYASIMVNYKRIHLGYFATEIEAAKAYNKGATKYFGEFAKLNDI